MGTSEVGSEWVKAAPADEARAVRHATHREVRAPEVLLRGFLDKSAKAHPVGKSSEPYASRSKLACANS